MEPKPLLSIKWIERFAIAIIFAGIIFILVSILVFKKQFSIAENGQIDSSATSDIGQFIGSIVGPIWSLASILLFWVALRYQSKELSAQLEEFKGSNKEFHLNRLTNILYHQAEKINNTIANYGTNSNGITILHGLYKKFEFTPTYVMYLAANETAKNSIISEVWLNWQELNRLNDRMVSAVMAIHDGLLAFIRILERSNLSAEEQHELLSLFKDNLGSNLIKLMNKIVNNIEIYNHKYPEDQPSPHSHEILSMIKEINTIISL